MAFKDDSKTTHRTVPEIIALKRVHIRVNGRIPAPGDCVFLGVRGKPWRANANGPAGTMLRAVLRKAGIAEIDAADRRVDIHSLRRTCCARYLRYGVPLNTAARLLGHRDTRTTSAHYVDVEAEDLVNAVARVQDLGAITKPMTPHAPSTKTTTTA